MYLELLLLRIEGKSPDVMKLLKFLAINMPFPEVIRGSGWTQGPFEGFKLQLKQVGFLRFPRALKPTRNCCFIVNLHGTFVSSTCEQSWSSPWSGEKLKRLAYLPALFFSNMIVSSTLYKAHYCFPGNVKKPPIIGKTAYFKNSATETCAPITFHTHLHSGTYTTFNPSQ